MQGSYDGSYLSETCIQGQNGVELAWYRRPVWRPYTRPTITRGIRQVIYGYDADAGGLRAESSKAARFPCLKVWASQV